MLFPKEFNQLIFINIWITVLFFNNVNNFFFVYIAVILN